MAEAENPTTPSGSVPAPPRSPTQGHLPHARVAHAMPGRVRLRLDWGRGQPYDLLERVQRRLVNHPGIRRVDFDSRTGSVLVLGEVATEMLQRIGEEEGLFRLIPPKALHPLEEDLTHGLEVADGIVRRASAGRVGLMGLVVASLGALAVVQMGRGRFDVPAPTLLWYTLSAVLMLRSRPAT